MSDQYIFYLMIPALVYGFYKAYRKKNEKLFYGLLLILFIRLSQFPLYLPVEFSMALWAFLGCGVLFYKGKVKKIDGSLIIFSLMFFALGLILLLNALKKINAF